MQKTMSKWRLMMLMVRFQKEFIEFEDGLLFYNPQSLSLMTKVFSHNSL